MILSGCSLITKTETEYIEREKLVYNEIPRELLRICEHPNLKGSDFRALAELTADYKSALDNCNNRIEEIENWNKYQKDQVDER